MKPLFLTLLIVTATPIHAAWQTYKGITVWTNYSSENRTFSWTGTTDSDGKADGGGVFTLYFKGEKIATYTGTMRQGRMDGHVKAIYHKDKLRKTYEGELRDWSEDGFGTLTLADGTKQTGRWQKGTLVEAITEEAETPTLAPKPEPTVVTPSSAGSTGGVVALAPGIQPPGEGSSATEKFLYGLATATESYILDAAYKPGYGNNVLTDACWALYRAVKVEKLVESPLASDIPAALRDFCAQALRLDALLQASERASENAINRAKGDARDMFIDWAQRFSKEGENDMVNERSVGGIFGMIARAQQVEQMVKNLVREKRDGDFHRKWSLLLNRLASGDAALRPYAEDPRVTDPTWHFMRAAEAGDVFFGQCYSSRAREPYALDRMPRPKVPVGDLAKGPIEVRISKRGAFACQIFFNVPRGDSGPILVGSCSRGHFAFFAGDEIPWVARGLSDSQYQGKRDLSESSLRGQSSTLIMHLPTTGRGEDSEAFGSLLIYLRNQATSDEEAREIAQRVTL